MSIVPQFSASDYVRMAPLPRLPAFQRMPRPIPGVCEVQQLIRALAATDGFDSGYSCHPTQTSFPAFLPTPVLSGPVRGYYPIQYPRPIRMLVAAGAPAIPLLLDSLNDQTPTRVELQSVSGRTILRSGTDIAGNPFNDRENRAFSRYKAPRAKPFDTVVYFRASVGDLCFVALGKIVGRPYVLMSQYGSPCVEVSNPSRNAALVQALRTAWQSTVPQSMLLETLLIDFSTRCKTAGTPLNLTSIGTEFQTSAALRLLFYYPDIGGQLVAERLDALDVRGIPQANQIVSSDSELKLYGQREERNGVETCTFIQAVSWCRDGRVAAALHRIALRTTDKEILNCLR